MEKLKNAQDNNRRKLIEEEINEIFDELINDI